MESGSMESDSSSSHEELKEKAEEAPLCLKWAALSLSGTKKPLNDDSFLLFSASPGGMQTLLPEGEMPMGDDDLFFGVSDGMGGGKAGNIASSLLLEEISRIIPKTFHMAAAGFRPDYSEFLEKTVKYVHEGVNMCAEVHSEWDGMSATLTLAWFTPENMYMANVGDSRLYLCRNGETRQISKDHTFAWTKWKRGEINEFQYRCHPRRAALYEVIGGGHQLLSPHVAAEPYKRGDRFLLCTDGVVDGLWERHIGEYLSDNSMEPHDLVKALGEHAMGSDNKDDKTLIVIEVE